MISQATMLFQYASVAVFALTLVACVWGVRRRPRRAGLFLAPLLFAGAGVIYYALAFAGQLSTGEFLLWGAAHRFVGAALILGGVVALAAVLVVIRDDE